MKELSKFDEAREQFRILSSPYVISETYKKYGNPLPKRDKRWSTFWDTEAPGYVPRVEYCKFRPR